MANRSFSGSGRFLGGDRQHVPGRWLHLVFLLLGKSTAAFVLTSALVLYVCCGIFGDSGCLQSAFAQSRSGSL